MYCLRTDPLCCLDFIPCGSLHRKTEDVKEIRVSKEKCVESLSLVLLM